VSRARRGFRKRAVRDLNGEGHSVLTVKTDHGDFALDNLSDEIRPWTAAGYQFYKRQAQECVAQPQGRDRVSAWNSRVELRADGQPSGTVRRAGTIGRP
jgi:hypothetical protein